ncbi:hypothetical protein [Flavobacterium algicola]|uniref:hypothetical protein n=1 Tax=Flavobacterium algicola TaxID=556529 RepID=UPI001EFE91FF|nr:hypothetical protein [Flavobacterium algicola]MCG9791621.1 hypothetical protein [Flavobacterium algicola]
MEVKLPFSENLELNSSNNDTTGYYLVSTRWTMINDDHITFIRRRSLGYCYNLNWAGPLSRYDAEKIIKNKETTLIISHAALIPFLVTVNNELVVPNNAEVRKLIGFKAESLQQAN